MKEDLEKSLSLLLSKSKDDNEKRSINLEYQTIWQNLDEIFFENEMPNKSDNNNNDSSKNKGDNSKNRFAQMENSKLEIRGRLEILFNIVRIKEKTDYDDYLNEEEEPPIIKALINEIQQLEKFYNSLINIDEKKLEKPEKNEKYKTKKKIELYLFLIYLILKNYPFYITKRSYLEEYFLKLRKYKDWPDQIGCQGKNLYSLFINELYLPGITIFKEIRDKYLLDSFNPDQFFLLRDDFLRYYFIDDNKASSYNLDSQDIKSNDIFKIPRDIEIYNKVHKLKSDMKSLKEFNCLTIMHLIIFFCQEILSHNKKIQLNDLQRLCQQYFKAIPDYKIKGDFINFFSIPNILIKEVDKKRTFEIIKEETKEIFKKKNVPNKSLLNSFFNICDEGLKTDYFKNFLPMVKNIEKKIMNSINSQEGQHNIDILNLRKYLKPKIEIKEKSKTMYELYQYNYINIQDKYLSHLNEVIDYSNYKIEEKDKERVDQFNIYVNNKRNILDKFIKLRFIIHEKQLVQFINDSVRDSFKLYGELKNAKNIEKEREKENEFKEKKSEPVSEKKSRKKGDRSQIEKEKLEKELEKEKERKMEEDKQYSKILKNLKYYELKYLENDQKNDKKYLVTKEIENRKLEVLPDIEKFLNSIILYVLPNEPGENSGLDLSDYIGRNDFIYQYLFCSFGKKPGYDDLNLLRKENLCIYLEEAKNFFELDIYKIILTPKNGEKVIQDYFYSFIEIDILDNDIPKITYVNDMENPEGDKKIENTYIKKIFIVNLMNSMYNEKYKIDGMVGAKYILNENCGNLTVFCLTGNLNERNNNNNSNTINNMNYYWKILMQQTNSIIFNCDLIEITGNINIVQGVNHESNSKDSVYEELIVGHATYGVLDNEKRIKLKIATFDDFNNSK